jgi:hypothetical protein
MPILGHGDAQRLHHLAERSRSSARSMARGEVPRILTPASASSRAMFSGVWPAELHDHALGLFLLVDAQHVLDVSGSK